MPYSSYTYRTGLEGAVEDRNSFSQFSLNFRKLVKNTIIFSSNLQFPLYLWFAPPENFPKNPGTCTSRLVLTLHKSSSLLICVAVICLALACSLSDGCFTSQLRKHLSWITGIHDTEFLGRQTGKISNVSVIYLYGVSAHVCVHGCVQATCTHVEQTALLLSMTVFGSRYIIYYN